ncbi:hypothetical protein [Ciceribacter thiooxidans]|uniref:Uncharacterized protein n=1 Tax=Ciceribacter thiooxidans TaxID=1969821 RepID=A0ABV7HYU2_9HYPH|nr:hypothetical protein [Ciceribacter thiooxidans]
MTKRIRKTFATLSALKTLNKVSLPNVAEVARKNDISVRLLAREAGHDQALVKTTGEWATVFARRIFGNAPLQPYPADHFWA